MDEALKKAIMDPSFRMLLLPLAGTGNNGSQSNESSKRKDDDPDVPSQKQRRRIEAFERELRTVKESMQKGGSGKWSMGKGKSNGKGKKGKFNRPATWPSMPAPIQGKAWETPTKDPICFNYNMPGGCDKAQRGQSCPKGKHVCCEWGCYEAHSFQDHQRLCG